MYTVKPQPGDDVHALINAAFAAQAGTSSNHTAAAAVQIAPGIYTATSRLIFPTSYTAPFITAPTLECNGATIVYSGPDPVAVELLARNATDSGTINNCNWIFVTPGSHPLMHSATHFHWKGGSMDFRPGVVNPGLDMVNDNSAAFGGAGYFEDDLFTFRQVSVSSTAGSCGITWRIDPTLAAGGGSFFYDFWEGIHADIFPNTALFCTQVPDQSGAVKRVLAFGGNYQIHVNGGGSVFYVQDASGITRGTLELTGECNNGPCYDVWTVNGGGFEAFGRSLATGWFHHFTGNSASGNGNINIKGTDQSPSDIFPYQSSPFRSDEPGSVDPAVQGISYVNGSFNLIALPNYASGCSETLPVGRLAPFWRIGHRNVSTQQWVETNNGSPFLLNIDVTANCHGVIFGSDPHDGSGNTAWPTAQHGNPDASAHNFRVFSPNNTGTNGTDPAEWGVFADASGTHEMVYNGNFTTENLSLGTGQKGAFTGDISIPTTPTATVLHFINGRVWGVN